MWVYNNNFGKWSLSDDNIKIDTFNLLKQELSATRFYSRILSGATFIPVNDLDNIYDILGEWEPRSWYINNIGSQYSDTMTPTRNATAISNDTSYEYYTKFISEYGLTLKTLFTPDRLIKDSINNFYYVDVATTEKIDLKIISNSITIDGILLKNGHRVLVKDQITIETLTDINPDEYFKGDYRIIENFGGTVTYEYFNSENGIYVYDGKQLVRDNILDDYSNCVRLSLVVKEGIDNKEKQYHLKRLKNGYFPSTRTLEPITFIEKHNWMLRNRVDYNNLFEINYYDVIKHGTQSYQIDSITYSIPTRTISVGEFGVILNTQNLTGIQGISNILPNKFKVNLRSITQTSKYYWICGDDSTLLKVRKHDFYIEKISIDTQSNLTSISFFNDLRGVVVGEFNTIFITTDGGKQWNKVKIVDFSPYNYNKVLFTDADRFYIGGQNGVFIELYEDQSGWTAFKRRIFKEIDDDDEYLLVDGITDLYKTTIDSWGLSYSFGNTQSTSSVKELVFITTNNNNIIVYDTKDATEYDFLYLDFGKDYGDIRNITRQSGTNNFYFTAQDGLYSFDINNFQYIGIGNTYSNSIAGTYATPISSFYANEIFDYEGDELIICGNNSLLKTTNYNTIDFKLLDDDFEKRLHSKLLFMDYDIGAKLNWFTDQGDYRMPNSATFSTSDAFAYSGSNRSDEYLYEVGFGPIIHSATAPSMLTQSELSWLDYWKDTQKTFEYYSDYPLNDYSLNGLTGSMVLISTTFSYVSGKVLTGGTQIKKNKISFYKDIISNDYDDIKSLAPSFEYGVTDYNGMTYSSRYTKSNLPNISEPASVLVVGGDGTDVKIYLHDYLMILRVPKSTANSLYNVPKIGDVIRLESPIVDVNLIVNKVWNSPVISGNPQSGKYSYIYMYSEFNQNIITDLILNAGDSIPNSTVSIKNLNVFENINELISNFNLHTIGNAYELDIKSSVGNSITAKSYDLELKPKFNNLTSYYNLATNVYISNYDYSLDQITDSVIPMVYTNGFLKFGYTATYNLLDYLENINKNNQNSIFYATKEYLALPVYKGIPLGSLTTTTAYIDFNGITQSNTTGNKILFGESLKLEWESIMINTFVDVSIYQPSAGGTFSTERLLVMNKYTIKNIDNLGIDAYVIEFHKRMNFSLGTDFNNGTIDILSRRSLLQISEDLQELNNIHKANLKTKHIANDTFGYNNYQRELNFKVPTDSYAKAFLSDVDTVNSLSAIMYIDYKNELTMNITKLDRDYNIPIVNTSDFNGQLFISCSEKHGLNKYDGVILEFNGGVDSSSELNQNYFGFRVVTEIYSEYDFTVDLPFGNDIFIGNDTGFVKFIKRDPFLNYQPVDLIDIGVNKRGQIAIELLPENTTLQNGVFSLSNVDFSKYRFKLIDGLNIETLSVNYPWMLEAEVSGAVLGLDDSNRLVWYKGIWEAGRWFGGTWISGTWKYGDWYDGTWNSNLITDKKISIDIDQKTKDETQSVWHNGRWYNGTWNNGTWLKGRFYSGEWNSGVWNNGTWNDGTWNDGRFIGGVWVTGIWNNGIFNTDSDVAYWIDGTWNGGDFENGMWYNGSFESKNNEARFGTKAYNSRTATWHGGKWISGSFFSQLGSIPDVSDVHKYSIWYTGQWLSGDFYGGIAYNMDFKSGVWHGGILEDIQIIGMNENNNSFILNGIFKFNIGDEIYVIDNNNLSELSSFGSNNDPKKYTVLYTVEDRDNKFTEVYVATNITDFSGKYLSYKNMSTNYDLQIATSSYITDTILIDDAQDNVKDVKLKINLTQENNLVEKYVPVTQYKTTTPTYPIGVSTGNIITTIEPLSTTQQEFLSQNIIGLRKSDNNGSITISWGKTPNGYFGPGQGLNIGDNLNYVINATMSSIYSDVYDVKERVLDPISLSELSSVNITSGTEYITTSEVYSYKIELSDDHQFTTLFASYYVDLVYDYTINGLDSDKFYYFRVTEMKSSGIGNLKINLKSPNGRVIGIKDFNLGNSDSNMINTVFTFNTSLDFNTGAPIYKGDFNMDRNTSTTLNSLYEGDVIDYDISSIITLSGSTMSNGNWTIYIENSSNYNTGTLKDWELQFGYSDTIGAKLYDNSTAIDTGLRIVSNFQNVNWKTGIWTNGLFNNGLFESGLWYNGVFNGTWG